MKILDHEQGSLEWFTARAGIPTASQFDKIVTSKGEPSKQSTKYLYQLAGERITGIKSATYQNEAMARGIELEDEARQLYSLLTDEVVETVGLCLKDGEIAVGASPDGLVGSDGGIEVKCPLIQTHVEYLLKNELPTTYLQQVQGSMYVTNRQWWSFVSYYPGMKLFNIRVERDEEFIGKLDKALQVFCKDLDDVVEKIR